MNITFLIGNGFDLSLKLNTRYTDFYKYYIKNDPNDKLKTNPRLTNYIVKSAVNTALGEKKIEKAKEIIDKSKYVCLVFLLVIQMECGGAILLSG